MEIKEVAARCLSRAESLLSEWFPNGKRVGREFEIGDISGSAGRSLRVNIDTGKWADFSADIKGGDLVSLYAAKNNISQVDAAKALDGYAPTDQTKPDQKPEIILTKPPIDRKPPTTDKVFGEATHVYTYMDENSEPIFYVARYDLEDGTKEMRPFSYTTLNKWTRKAPSAPRPLYGLNRLNGKDKVLIVEGEKAADAAQKFASKHYAVVTWPNGANAVDKVDWSPLFKKDILIWPDHDDEGRKAASYIAKTLLSECPSVKVINTKALDLPKGWDAADSGFKYNDFIKWAKPLVKAIDAPKTPEIMPDVPPPKPKHVVQQTTNILITADRPTEKMTIKISANESANISRCGLQTSQKGIPAENFLNVSRIIVNDFKSRFWFDDFYRSFMTDIDGQAETLSDNHIFQIMTLVQSSYGLRKISRSIITDGICSACYTDRRHAARDWVKTLTWDGVARVETFFSDNCGAEDNEVNREISKYFFTSFAARLLGPEFDPASGNKVDAMVVLEGDQGIGKGMLLKAIVGPSWHYEVSRGMNDKDFYQDMRGKLLAEFADFNQFEPHKLSQVKQLITCQTDRMRVSYGRESQDFDRVCIFVATTNEKEYLFDSTGNRRFLPIRLGKINLKAVRKIREQLFAEAVVLYKANVEKWWRFKHWDALTKVRADRMVSDLSDDWLHIIQNYTTGRDKVKTADIWVHAFNQDIGKLTKPTSNAISKAMRTLGWNYRAVREAGSVHKAWCRPIELENPLPPQPKKPLHNYAQDLY